MKIDRTPVTWFLERLFCDCGGEMKQDWLQYYSHHPHRCEKCGLIEVTPYDYPRVMWEEVK